MDDNTAAVAIVGMVVVFGGCFLAWLYLKNKEQGAVPASVSLGQLRKWGVVFER